MTAKTLKNAALGHIPQSNQQNLHRDQHTRDEKGELHHPNTHTTALLSTQDTGETLTFLNVKYPLQVKSDILDIYLKDGHKEINS